METVPFDASEFLGSETAQSELLDDAFATGEARFIAHALGVVARARGMTQVARDAGVTREALYRALSVDGDPRLTTLLGVMKALGVGLTVTPRPSFKGAMRGAGLEALDEVLDEER